MGLFERKLLANRKKTIFRKKVRQAIPVYLFQSNYLAPTNEAYKKCFRENKA